MEHREIYCCGCGQDVKAELTDGGEIYPHRQDLIKLPFWICRSCSNFVGCHHKTKQRTRPLGCIPTKEIRSARGHIHKILDPLWKYGNCNRGYIYSMISKRIGYEYHTAEIRTLEDARIIYAVIKKIRDEINKTT